MIFGTAFRKLVRRNAPETSIVAAALLNTSELEEMVYSTIKDFGHNGCIQDDVLRRHASYPYSSITARFRALIDKGLLEETGDKRPGNSGRMQRVLRAVV